MSKGVLMGLNRDQEISVEDCADCITFGKKIGQLQYGYVFVENLKDTWFDKSKVTETDIT